MTRAIQWRSATPRHAKTRPATAIEGRAFYCCVNGICLYASCPLPRARAITIERVSIAADLKPVTGRRSRLGLDDEVDLRCGRHLGRPYAVVSVLVLVGVALAEGLAAHRSRSIARRPQSSPYWVQPQAPGVEPLHRCGMCAVRWHARHLPHLLRRAPIGLRLRRAGIRPRQVRRARWKSTAGSSHQSARTGPHQAAHDGASGAGYVDWCAPVLQRSQARTGKRGVDETGQHRDGSANRQATIADVVYRRLPPRWNHRPIWIWDIRDSLPLIRGF